MPTIQGNLPFDSMAAAGQAMAPLAQGGAGAVAALPGAYAGAYKSALDFNSANYGNILKGYQDTLAGQTDALSAISRGYTGLSADVLAGIQGVGASEQQRINDQYSRDIASSGQSLASRGLGNSTVVDAEARGIGSDRDRANLALAGQIAQMRAGYQSNIGLAGLGQQQQAALANTGLAQNQLGFMERVNAPYPDAGLFASIAQQGGYAQQAGQDRQAALNAARAAGQPVPQSAGTVSKGGGGFFTQPSDFSSGGSYQPQTMYGGVQSRRQPAFGPPPGTTLIAQPDAFTLGGYAVPTGQGFSGGFGNQGYGADQGAGYNLAGEDQPYGQPTGAALGAGSVSPYPSPYGAMSYSGSGAMNPAAYGGYDPAAYGLTESDLTYYGY